MGYLTMAETENRKDTKYTPDTATEPTEGKWELKDKDGEPTLDHLLFDLIDYLCRDYKNSDWTKGSVMILMINLVFLLLSVMSNLWLLKLPLILNYL